VNARAAVDRSGFGGHTPIFNCVMTFNAGRRHEVLGRLLLDRGADPNARASIASGSPARVIAEFMNIEMSLRGS
jgi:hypothetical protein